MLQGYIGAMHTAFFVILESCNFLTGRSLVPKRIEIKPIVRRNARVMLQALGVALHPPLDLLSPTITIQCDLIGKMLEVNFVTVPATVEAEKQHNRTMRHRGKHDWADRERRWPAKEAALACLTIAGHAVAQSSDEEPRIQTFLNCQQSIHPIRRDYGAGDHGIQGIQKAGDILVVRWVH